MFVHGLKRSKIIAIIFIIFSIICIVFAFVCKREASMFIGASTTLATLAGAILIFSTLDVQRKTLDEERSKNKYSRFDSRFYPILSNFRMDAANMEIIYDYIATKGKMCGHGTRFTYNADKAFFVARQIISTLLKGIRIEPYSEFDADVLEYELKEIKRKYEFLDEDWIYDEELNAIEDEETACIKSYQVSYILYKYGIINEVRDEYKKLDDETLISSLLNKLIEHQPTMLAKYIQSLRFIIKIIEGLTIEMDKKDYYLNISCILGKEEYLFLKCFKEFDIITNNNH